MSMLMELGHQSRHGWRTRAANVATAPMWAPPVSLRKLACVTPTKESAFSRKFAWNIAVDKADGQSTASTELGRTGSKSKSVAAEDTATLCHTACGDCRPFRLASAWALHSLKLSSTIFEVLAICDACKSCARTSSGTNSQRHSAAARHNSRHHCDKAIPSRAADPSSGNPAESGAPPTPIATTAAA